MRILHGESSIAGNWAPRNLFRAMETILLDSSSQFSGKNERNPYRMTPMCSCPTPRFSKTGLALPRSTKVTDYLDPAVSTPPHHHIACKKVDSIAFYFLKTCAISCAST
jgi:hypothetical protein